jgi:hypothetical protein
MDKLTHEALGQKVTDIPKKDSAQWKRNESIIANTPQLRRMRDIQQGFKPSSSIHSAGFGDNYDKIDFSNKDKTKKGYRVKVNGKYVDEE